MNNCNCSSTFLASISNFSCPPAASRPSRRKAAQPCPEGAGCTCPERAGAALTQEAGGHGIMLNEQERFEEQLQQGFLAYCHKLRNSVLVFSHKEDSKKLLFISPARSSRYFQEGRKKIKKNIRKTLKKAVLTGVLLTLTYDTKRISRSMAWQECGKHLRAFLDNVNKVRKRKGMKRRLIYFWCLEEQAGTGYPHYHIFFPGLKFLLHYKLIDRLWGYGFSRVEYSRTVNCRSYITKYVTKLKGWSILGQAYLWYFKRRLYDTSCSLKRYIYQKNKEKKNKEWICPIYVCFDNPCDLLTYMSDCLKIGYTIVNPDYCPP